MERNLKLHDVNFSWEEVNTIFLRAEAHFKNYSIRRADSTKEMIVLDAYSMMNATYAKCILSNNTICV